MRALPFAALAFAVACGSACAETAVDPERAAKGETLYADYCSTCHGFELKNTGGVYSLRFGDPNLAPVPPGGTLWTFKLFEE